MFVAVKILVPIGPRPRTSRQKKRQKTSRFRYPNRDLSLHFPQKTCFPSSLPLSPSPARAFLLLSLDVYECRGGKRSKVSPRGALNLPAARFLQTERFDPLFPPPPPPPTNCFSDPPSDRRDIEKASASSVGVQTDRIVLKSSSMGSPAPVREIL